MKTILGCGFWSGYCWFGFERGRGSAADCGIRLGAPSNIP